MFFDKALNVVTVRMMQCIMHVWIDLTNTLINTSKRQCFKCNGIFCFKNRSNLYMYTKSMGMTG